MINWIIKSLGGYTRKEMADLWNTLMVAQKEAQQQARIVYLEKRRQDLQKDVQSAIKAKRKHSDIQDRFNLVVAELVKEEDKQRALGDFL